MFNIGTGEIALIAVVALLLLGPERLPELARGIGKFMREFRRQTDDVRNVVEREFYRMDEDVRPPADIVSTSKFMPPNKQSATPELPLDSAGGAPAAPGASPTPSAAPSSVAELPLDSARDEPPLPEPEVLKSQLTAGMPEEKK